MRIVIRKNFIPWEKQLSLVYGEVAHPIFKTDLARSTGIPYAWLIRKPLDNNLYDSVKYNNCFIY